MTGYTVVDLETTGLFPGRHDRIIEIGLVQLSPDGEVETEWSTLVNPGRDVGPTSIHGVSARDVLDAPSFADIAPHVVAALTGRTLVAHNARFDTAFLESEFARARSGTRSPTPSLCTMQLSGSFLRGASRRLRDCCAAAGITHADAHTALGDARAVAALLAFYLARCGRPEPWAQLLGEGRDHWWPVLAPGPGRPPLPRAAGRRRPDAWLDRITSDLPRNPEPLVESYLHVLETALLDGHLSAHEEHALVDLAVELGLQRDQVAALHATHLDAMALAAWADGVVTDLERQELHTVAAALGLPAGLVPLSLGRAESLLGGAGRPAAFRLRPGDQVVFTGELSVPRAQLVALVEQSGLRTGSVTRGTALVVAADPDSLSGKAAKARAWGIPVVTEAGFARLLTTLW